MYYKYSKNKRWGVKTVNLTFQISYTVVSFTKGVLATLLIGIQSDPIFFAGSDLRFVKYCSVLLKTFFVWGPEPPSNFDSGSGPTQKML